jgi:uncharacterized Fe-S cluster-containing radical SAM superfamily protein
MHVVFVYGAYENLGIETLSACLKRAGHRVSLVYSPLLFRDATLDLPGPASWLNRDDALVERAVRLEPDLLAVSSVTDWFQWQIDFVRAFRRRRPGTPVIWGGIHPTTAPERVLAHPEVDWVCVGEGEEALVELCDALDAGRGPEGIANLRGRGFANAPRPLIRDLDALPFPDKDLFYAHAPYLKSAYTIMGSRGCPFRCTFCNNDALRRIYADDRPFVRRRSVASMLDELEQGLRRHDFRAVLFEDDVFTGDIARTRAFCEGYKRRIGRPFVIETHPLTTDPEELALLRDAGCVQVEIGVQTLNPEARRRVGRHESNAQIEAALRALSQAGIPFFCDHIVGLAGDDVGFHEQALRLYNEVRPSRLNCFFLSYYPGTGVAEDARNRGVLDPDLEARILAGRTGSNEQFGSLTDADERAQADSLRFIFAWLPLLPRPMVAWLLDGRRYRRLPRSVLASKILAGLFATVFGREPRGDTILARYVHHLLRLGR